MSFDLISTTTPSIRICRRRQQSIVDITTDCLRIKELNVQYITNTQHEQCFDKVSTYVYEFVLCAFPGSVLCEASIFYSDYVYYKLALMFTSCYRVYKSIQNIFTQINETHILSDQFVYDFMVEFKNCLIEWHTIRYNQMPYAYELLEKCVNLWNDCSMCKI